MASEEAKKAAQKEVEKRLAPMIRALNTVREVNDKGRQAVQAWADSKTRPAPVAKDTGLVTVETQFRMTDRTDRPWGNGPIPEYLNGYAVSRELVTRSQAEELLAAAHDEKMFHVNDAVKAWNEVSRLETRVETLEADNAAKDARIKELEHVVKSSGKIYSAKMRQIEAIEAKLAAARKALERFLEAYKIDYDLYGASIEARAALEAKP